MCAKFWAERTIASDPGLTGNALVNAYITVTELLCLEPSDLSGRDRIMTFLLSEVCRTDGVKDEAALVEAAVQEFAATQP